ncbi:fungal-specific transcription factor domain-containing protein [Aspergillus egyptiacus]|nr:fungal-specific transcription factor domain-containing protein [Aspergillus egyptiacus]
MSGSETASKPRHRASVACVACRERRTRCVVNPGQGACTQCLEAGHECIIKNDDQRRKPVSKAYVNQLQDRIQQLEAALQEKETQQSTYPPQSTQTNYHNHPDASSGECSSQSAHSDANNIAVETPPSPGRPVYPHPDPHSDPHPDPRPDPQFRPQQAAATNVQASPSASHPRKPSMAHRLLSTRGHVSFDQLAGRQRYFGPTTNCHIYLDLASESEESRGQAREQARRTQRVLSTLSQASQDYLTQLYWKYYNSVIRVVDQEAFEEGKEAGGGPFYSGFLHICILAAGYRFADKQRPDMVRIGLAGRESLLHREAKYMLDYEMERPGGLPSIAALLLLGDLEVGCGRDNVGWLYSGMAYRLCFDVGLHLDRSGSGLSQRDLEIGRMTLWACVIFDRYWALFLGRPTALKPDDLEIYELSQQFDRLGTAQPGPEKSLEMQIYQALFELMELGGKITGIQQNMSSRNAEIDRVLHLRMAALDSELERWYARLPEGLRYTAQNASSAPPPFFLLHQQYYSIMIMLHRPFAGYDDILDTSGQRRGDDGASDPGAKHLSALSHATCTKCAGRIAQIFWQQRQRFDTRRIFVTGLQHAGNAATALVAAIASSTDLLSNDRSMRYLECLIAVLDDLTEAYQPAEQMATILKSVLQELRELQPALQPSNSVPARRGSSVDCDSEPDHLPSKRGPSTRSQAKANANAQTHTVQPMSWPGESQFAKPQSSAMPAILPSPAMTYQSLAEKPSARRLTDPDGLMADSGMANMDDSWSIFTGADRFAINNVMAGHSSPAGFCSPWPGADTPSFFRLANEAAMEPGSMNSDLMHLVHDGDRAAQGTAADEAAISGAAGPGVNSLPDTGGISQGITHSTDSGYTPSSSRIRGHPPEKRKAPGGRAESIWTEIIS